MHSFNRILTCLLTLFALATASFSSAFADLNVGELQTRIYSTIDEVRPAVVSVGQRGGSFSGVIVSKDGHVLSAGHAVSPGGRYQVTLPDGRRFTARGKGSNPLATARF